MEKRKYKDKITIVLILLVIIFLFASGFYISSKYIADKYSDEEIELCGKIAKTVHENGEQALVGVTDNITVIKTDSYIQVKIANRWGWVNAKQADNGDVITIYESFSGIRFILNCLVATLFALVITSIIIVIKKRIIKH